MLTRAHGWLLRMKEYETGVEVEIDAIAGEGYVVVIPQSSYAKVLRESSEQRQTLDAQAQRIRELKEDWELEVREHHKAKNRIEQLDAELARVKGETQ